MNENIDLTKILKDCPKGTKLYSTVLGCVTLEEINDYNLYPIVVSCKNGNIENFTADGKMIVYYDGECTLFPSRDQKDWSKFTALWYKKDNLVNPKFKVGDWIISSVLGIAHIIGVNDSNEYQLEYIDGKQKFSSIDYVNYEYDKWTINDARDGDVLAISWLGDKNLFEKIIIFKKYHSEGVKGLYSMPCVEGYGKTFKNGKMAFPDEEVPYYSKTWTCNLHPATKEQYDVLMKAMNDAGYEWDIEKKDFKKLVSNRFDPKTLQPFDKVIVKISNLRWKIDLFAYYCDGIPFPCMCSCYSYRYCIPYNDETKHLIGTTEEAPEYYRYWEE